MASGLMCVEHCLGSKNAAPYSSGYFHKYIGCIFKYIQRTVCQPFCAPKPVLDMSIGPCSEYYYCRAAFRYLKTKLFIQYTVWSGVNDKHILNRIVSSEDSLIELICYGTIRHQVCNAVMVIAYAVKSIPEKCRYIRTYPCCRNITGHVVA